MRCCIPLQGVLWRAMCEFARETVEARQRNPDMLGLPSLAQAMWQVLVCVFAGFCAYCTFDV